MSEDKIGFLGHIFKKYKKGIYKTTEDFIMENPVEWMKCDDSYGQVLVGKDINNNFYPVFLAYGDDWYEGYLEFAVTDECRSLHKYHGSFDPPNSIFGGGCTTYGT